MCIGMLIHGFSLMLYITLVVNLKTIFPSYMFLKKGEDLLALMFSVLNISRYNKENI